MNLSPLLIGLLSLLTLSCSNNVNYDTPEAKLRGTIRVDGSSTVFPITEAVAEEYGKVYVRVRTTVGVSGTGGGFKKFVVGEIDINDASRPIKPIEKEKAKENNIKYLELPVAYDGISVVVNNANDWVDYMTVDELKKIWEPGSTVKTWKDVRPSWPDKEIRLYGPGTDSGTFDYFTEAVNGKSHVSRSDFTKSEDDNVIIQGVAGDRTSLGYFGFAYYTANSSKVKIVPIKDGDKQPIVPSDKTINDGTYTPLARPIFIYVNKASLKKPQVLSFVRFYLENATTLSQEAGYVPLPKDMYMSSLKILDSEKVSLK